MCLVVMFPFFCYFFLKLNLRKLEKPEFRERFGSLFENIEITRKNYRSTVMMVVVFLVKRLLIAFVTVYFDWLPVV